MTLKELTELLIKYPNSFNNLFGEFLDNFYRTPQEERFSLIEEEPICHESFPRQILPILSATAHKLILDYKIETEDSLWVYDLKYRLKDPYFSMDAKGELRLYLLARSPVTFKARNLFVEENVLDRA